MTIKRSNTTSPLPERLSTLSGSPILSHSMPNSRKPDNQLPLKPLPTRKSLMRAALTLAMLFLCAQVRAADPPVDFGTITEKHEMVPMRDGTKLSVYLYFPPGKGPWPVLLEQRYADLSAPNTRKAFAKLAEGGYVIAAQNFRGAGKSEGTWVGYRALGWGEQKDGYDTVEWLAKQ